MSTSTSPAPGSPRKLFLNIPVRDLKRAVDFFTQLGFTFNAQFTDDCATCMVFNEGAYAMLLTDPRFQSFTKRQICDTSQHVEALFAFNVDSRAAVDDVVKRALAAGGSPAMPKQDHGFMYGWSFHDPDGHQWEVFYMDPSHVAK